MEFVRTQMIVGSYANNKIGRLAARKDCSVILLFTKPGFYLSRASLIFRLVCVYEFCKIMCLHRALIL